MKKKGYKGRCEKRSLLMPVGFICEADPPQVKEFQCNVLLEGLSIGEYTTDFLYDAGRLFTGCGSVFHGTG